jgi:hypothetical protein
VPGLNRASRAAVPRRCRRACRSRPLARSSLLIRSCAVDTHGGGGTRSPPSTNICGQIRSPKVITQPKASIVTPAHNAEGLLVTTDSTPHTTCTHARGLRRVRYVALHEARTTPLPRIRDRHSSPRSGGLERS